MQRDGRAQSDARSSPSGLSSKRWASSAAAASGREIPLELVWAGNGLNFFRQYAAFLLVPPSLLLFLGQSARLVYRVASSSFGTRD